MKKTFTLNKYIDPNIKAGDKVKLIDGSAFTPIENVNKEYYIIFAYPKETGLDLIIKDIVCEVVFTNIENSICIGALEYVYTQDIIVQIGKSLFRTCSKFVKKI